MKVWFGYGSEHSANLIMIGHFEKASDAERVREIIQRLAEQEEADSSECEESEYLNEQHFSPGMLDLLQNVRFHSLGPAETEQFLLDVRVEVKDRDIILRTDEIEVSGFMKLLVDKGARVEVFSAHDYPKAAEAIFS